MGAITIKCPNCGGELVFEPASQSYKCPYCGSAFSQKEIDQMYPETEPDTQETVDQAAGQTRESSEADKQSDPSAGEAVLYNCPSCGAQIVTTDTTAATFCYYCHNPVVLTGRLQGEWQPDCVIPFSVSREQAREKLQSFIGRKKFVPKRFYDASQLEKITGVYYPYWLYSREMDGTLQGKATRVHVMRHGDDEITETDVFEVSRRGRLSFDRMTRNALQNEHRELVENVQPYRMTEAKPFKMSYLAGFQAEKRDMEKQAFAAELQKETEQYARKRMQETVSGYTTVETRHFSLDRSKEEWKYCLLPVWVMTYRASNGTIYYYALNGQTGEAVGKLPVDTGKLLLSAALMGILIMAAVTILLTVLL